MSQAVTGDVWVWTSCLSKRCPYDAHGGAEALRQRMAHALIELEKYPRES